jgi:arylsulfatase A-like enzyme
MDYPELTMDSMRIIAIEVYGLHLGYVGCYGNDWVATPNLDRLATEGIVFDWHFADQPELFALTPWQERSIGTGCYSFPGTPPVAPSITMILRAVRCEALSSFATDALQAIGANDGFLWIEGPSLLPPWHLDDELLEAYFDEDDVEEGLAPWTDPPLEFAKLNEAEVLQLQNTYAAAVTVFDAQLGVVLDRLREQKMLDDTLICVTSRSGLPLGEHGMIGAPGPWLHDELVHVPMLLRLPGAAQAGQRVAALTQPVDLLPTFLEALSQPIPPLHGSSLWPLLRGEVEQVRPYAVAAMRAGGQESWLMRTADWALHLPIMPPDKVPTSSPQLFVKPEDRWEVNDLFQQQIESAEVMATALRAFAKAIRHPGPLTYPIRG